MATPMTKVNGIGDILPDFVWQTEGIDFRRGQSANGHNEGRVDLFCQEDSGINDVVKMAGYRTIGGYHMEMFLDSEVNVPIFYEGRLLFDFNEATGHWTMHGMVDDRFWGFCDPEATVNLVISALECINKPFEAADDNWFYFYQLKITLENIATSLKNEILNTQENEANLINTASKYLKNEDCSFVPSYNEGTNFEGYGTIIF